MFASFHIEKVQPKFMDGIVEIGLKGINLKSIFNSHIVVNFLECWKSSTAADKKKKCIDVNNCVLTCNIS